MDRPRPFLPFIGIKNSPIDSKNNSSNKQQINYHYSINSHVISDSIINNSSSKKQDRFSFSPLMENSIFNKTAHKLPSSNMSACNVNPGKQPTRQENRQVKSKKRTKRKETAKDKRIKPVNRVCSILETIFKGELYELDLSDYEPFESDLINTIIDLTFSKVFKYYKSTKIKKRKTLIKEMKKNISQKNFNVLCTQTIKNEIVITKRKEEKLKFILKNTINHFRKKFFDDRQLKRCKENELLFLEHFYREHKAVYGCDVRVFSDPLSNTLFSNPKFKTLSNEYFKVLFSIPSFKALIMDYVTVRLKQDYQEKIFKKFRKLFKPLKLKLEFDTENEVESHFNEFIRSLSGRRFFKLPWFDLEIENAISVFSGHVEKIAKTDNNWQDTWRGLN